jgi:hypothetical protein
MLFFPSFERHKASIFFHAAVILSQAATRILSRGNKFRYYNLFNEAQLPSCYAKVFAQPRVEVVVGKMKSGKYGLM